jgi:methylmalonyl-CoA mutase N-terminal domain/subunit
VSESLKRIEEEAKENPTAEQAGTLMPALINAARAKCTIGEMANALFSAYGCVYPY